MKKSIVILLVAIVMMISGCQNTEKEAEIKVPSATELPKEDTVDVSSKETVEDADKSKNDEQTVEAEKVAEPEKTVESVENKNTSEKTEAVINVKNEEAIVDAAGEEENVYKEQMDLVYQALSQGWSIDEYFDKEISSLIANHYEGNALENVGYALTDLDGDGKEELLISAVSKDASAGMLYDVYTAPDGNVVHLLSGHERNRYFLQWLEEGAYMIANEASNSAFNSAWYYYSLIDGRLELMQGVVFDASVDENNPWFITYDEDWDVSNDTQDTDGTALAIIEANGNCYTTLEYIPFSEYNFS